MTRGSRRPSSPSPPSGSVWGHRVEPLEGRLLLASVPTGFTDATFASGLSNPTSMAFAPDGRLFVTQQGGQLRVVKNGALLPTPFLSVTTTSAGERGLLGVEFDPNFAANHYLYVYYTKPAATAGPFNRISRFTADPANPDVALAGSEVPLLNLDFLSTATNHNGGALHFGPDGKLYVAVGDNANGNNSQSFASFKGKILRLNPDGSAAADNPFYDATDGITAKDYTWAMGLRNPYTFAFQPGTGRMYINDVGEVTWEEIDEGLPGRNFGWPTTEGAFDPVAFPQFTNPVYTYQHSAADGGAITGGTFYNPADPQFPTEYVGDYFYGDFNGNYIRDLEPPAGLDLHGGHVIRANIDYDGTTLHVALRDLTSGQTNNQSYTVNIPGTLITDDNQGYVGFTGASGGLTAVQDILNWTYTPGGATAPAIDYGAGFPANGQGLNVIGSATTTPDGRLRLTSGGTNQKSNVYYNGRVDVTNFHTQFDFQLTRAIADGFTFIVQDNDLAATGVGGGGLGSQGIRYSVAVKFDIAENEGEGINSTGMYLNGADPTLPARRITVTPAFPTDFATNAGGPVDLDVGPDGALYYLSYFNGSVGRISHPVADTTGPRVSQVTVNRATWSSAFRTALGGAGTGYAVPGGAGQAGVLPWVGMDQIKVTFDEPVNATTLGSAGALLVMGVSQGSYPVAFAGYDAPTRTATWTVTGAGGLSRADRLTLELGGGGVTDVAGNALDGEWTTGQSYPSGNGSPGGAFLFNLNVLPGDATRDGRVDALDALDVRRRLFRSAANPGAGASAYTPFADADGDGDIDNLDYALVRQRLATRLPAAAPPPAVFSATRATATSLLVRRQNELAGLLD